MLQTLLDPAVIGSHPRNPRRAVGDVTDLAASLTSVGLLEPLVVAPWPADLDRPKPVCPTCQATTCRHAARKALDPAAVTHVLIAGHRRHAAARQAGLTEVPVVVREDLDTIGAQLEAMLVENLHRADLSPIEEASAYQALLDLDFTQVAIAASTAQPKTRIRDRLKLLKLPAAAQEKVHAGQITVSDAVALAGFEADPEYKTLASQIGTANWAWSLQRAKRSRQERRDLERRVGEFRNRGWDILDGKKAPAGYVELSQIVEGFPRYQGTPQMDAWAHQVHDDCPHRAVLITGDTWQPLRFFCATPEVHGTTGDSVDVDPEPTEEEQARQAEQAQLEADRAAATAVRREFLRAAVVSTPEAVIIDRLAATVLREQNYPVRAELTRDLLGEDPPPERLAGMTLPQLATLLLLVERGADEHWLARLGRRTLEGTQWVNERAWLTELRDVWGYQLSDFETALIAPPPDDDEDDEDDDGLGYVSPDDEEEDA